MSGPLRMLATKELRRVLADGEIGIAAAAVGAGIRGAVGRIGEISSLIEAGGDCASWRKPRSSEFTGMASLPLPFPSFCLLRRDPIDTKLVDGDLHIIGVNMTYGEQAKSEQCSREQVQGDQLKLQRHL
jgi:hypothetical protein